jgi:shikimate kinase
VVEREANFETLRAAGPVIWLKASPDAIVQRICGDDQRPSLTGDKSFTEEVSEVLQRRTPLYQRISHFQVDTDQRSAEEVAREICRLLGARWAK